jgi:predicted MFS family arabinose efflux permease
MDRPGSYIRSATAQRACLPELPAASPWLLYTEQQRRRMLAALFLVAMSNYLDRHVIAVLLEPIKQEFGVSDTLLGVLSGACFVIFYATFGLPIARWADRGNRRTIIALGLGAWSVMTTVCGLAQSFLQLALARVGVGAGEGGAIAPAQSLLADFYPPERRATAIGIFMSAATAGYLLGFGGGGYIAATYGWRTAFLAAGLPGLALVVIVRLGIDEPRLRLGFPRRDTGVESLRATLDHLRRKRSFRHAVLGCTLYFFMAYGVLIFVPSFLIRAVHVPLRDVSLWYGGVSAIASLVGTLGGGWVADRLRRRDIRWLAWLPAGVCLATVPLHLLTFASSNFSTILALTSVTSLLLTGGLPPVFAAIHAICGRLRRATAIAIVFFCAALLGNGLGPVAGGMLSDALSAHYGADGLRYAMQILTLSLVLTGIAFLFLARAMPADLED